MVSRQDILALSHDYFIGMDGKPIAICVDMEDFNNLPDKIDSVEVIRCENCRHRDDKWEDWEEGKVYWCDIMDRCVKAEDYCSYAERRAK